MGGRIGVESAPGLGSLFWFELTVEVSAALPAPESETAFIQKSPATDLVLKPVSRAGRPLRILVAEDNDTNRRLVMFMLAQLDCHADFAGNGLEAVEAWQRSRYDIILMDCQMPEMDGFEAARQTAAADRVRIIALTANALKGERERCLAAQMDDFLSKPFTLRQLKAMLLRQLRRLAGESDLAEPPALPAIFEPAKLAQLCGDLGEDNVVSIAQGFLAELPEKVSRLHGLAGKAEWSELARVAHSLQGIMATLGLGRLPAMFGELEHAAKAGRLEALRATLAALDIVVDQSVAELNRWLHTPKK
jgi:two-component system, sensor histidine kinase